MSESETITRLEYLEAQRRYFAKGDIDPDQKIMVLYELDQEIAEEKLKAKQT